MFFFLFLKIAAPRTLEAKFYKFEESTFEIDNRIGGGGRNGNLKRKKIVVQRDRREDFDPRDDVWVSTTFEDESILASVFTVRKPTFSSSLASLKRTDAKSKQRDQSGFSFVQSRNVIFETWTIFSTLVHVCVFAILCLAPWANVV